MTLIPHNLHFIWVGTQIPDKYVVNLLSWALQNPVYTIHLWTESAQIERCSYLIQEQGHIHPQFPGELEFFRSETPSGQQVTIVHETIPTLTIVINSIGGLEAISDPLYLAEEMTAWKNYGAASDILRVWVLYALGGIYMDLDTYPVSQKIPHNIVAPKGILFGEIQDRTYICCVNSVMASSKGNYVLRSLAVFIARSYYDDYPEEVLCKRARHDSGVVSMPANTQRELNHQYTARERLADIKKEQDELAIGSDASGFPSSREYTLMFDRILAMARVRSAIFNRTLTHSGPARVREWIVSREHQWINLKDALARETPQAEYEVNRHILVEYSFNLQAGYAPRVECENTWLKAPVT